MGNNQCLPFISRESFANNDMRSPNLKQDKPVVRGVFGRFATLEPSTSPESPTDSSFQIEATSASNSPATLLDEDERRILPKLRSSESVDSLVIEECDDLEYGDDDDDRRGKRPSLDFARIPEDHPYLFQPIEVLEKRLSDGLCFFGVDPEFASVARPVFQARRRRPELSLEIS